VRSKFPLREISLGVQVYFGNPPTVFDPVPEQPVCPYLANFWTRLAVSTSAV
jgi:hypothetical protein